jgi:hypothetical protein
VTWIRIPAQESRLEGDVSPKWSTLSLYYSFSKREETECKLTKNTENSTFWIFSFMRILFEWLISQLKLQHKQGNYMFQGKNLHSKISDPRNFSPLQKTPCDTLYVSCGITGQQNSVILFWFRIKLQCSKTVQYFLVSN